MDDSVVWEYSGELTSDEPSEKKMMRALMIQNMILRFIIIESNFKNYFFCCEKP